MVNLHVPCQSQLDNRLNPYGSCNVTSVAMVLQFFGFKGTGDGQLEDQLYQWMQVRGLSRHSPQDLAYLIETYTKDTHKPLKDRLVTHWGGNGKQSWEAVKKHLNAGFPVICHGYFTRFGHIVVIRGYNDKGFVINDPYGEWFTNGYDTSASGCNLTYSYGLMDRLCRTEDGQNWLHFIEPVKTK